MIDWHALRPDDLPEYLIPAWLGCMRYAISEPEIVAAFREDTGNQWKPPANTLEALVDSQLNRQEEFLVKFITWANTNVWGPLHDTDPMNKKI